MFTAHIDKNDKQRKQTVAEHCNNVAKLASGYADKINLQSTATLQGMLHDMGKLCADFDAYINGKSTFSRGEIDHAYAGAKYLIAVAEKSDNAYRKIAAGYIARTIVSHHGLHDWIDADRNSCFDKRISNSQRYDEILENAGEVFSHDRISETLTAAAGEIERYDKLLKELAYDKQSHKISPKKYLFYCGLFERLLQSLLIDADFTDTTDFMLNKKTEREINTKEIWDSASEKLDEKYREFAKVPNKLTARRTKISESCLEFADHEVGVCRLIVPTGGGKTLSSMRFAIEHCRKLGKDRIFYIAPFMSILEQNSDAIKAIVGGENFLEHYSDFALSIDGKEELDEYQLHADKWDPPVISTTLVQFLNTIYSGRSASVRRFHRLANSVIIIDEVQAIPLNCVNMFNLAVNFLARVCGAAVVLCTATQPCFDKTEYPIIFDSSADMNPDFREDFEFFHRTELISAFRPEKYSYEEAADFCSEKFDENGNILVVVNTKRAAADIFALLSEKYKSTGAEVIHLSTGMCPQHRRDTLNNIRRKLSGGLPVICVTTQLIEAGVDISFKCVVRSLAGLENAAQAAGRCNRNGEYPLCSAYIINIKDESLANLPEIRQRQRAAMSVIHGGKYPDLLETSAMDDYFEKFYYEQRDKLSYDTKIDNVKTTLVDVLSTHFQRYDKLKLSERVGKHMFATAGKEFKVIDNETEPVIVPYNDEAEKIISALNSELPLHEAIDIRRRAQKYTVMLYSGQIEKLTESGVLHKTENGIRTLDAAAYDKSGIGLLETPRALDELIF